MPSADPPRFWLRFDYEASRCPACESPRLALLDAFKIPRDARGRRVAFATACRVCGLVFANPLPTDADLRRLYAEDGDDRSYAAARTRRSLKGADAPPRARDEREVLFDALAAHLDVRRPAPGARVLDFGCGDGKYLDTLQDAGWSTFGIEPSTDVAFARHARLDAAPGDRSFDLVLLHHVLEHISHPMSVLRQIAGALRAGGVLFLSVPRLDTLAEHNDFKYCLNGRNHVAAYTEASLRYLLANAGFMDVTAIEAVELDEMLTGGKPLRLRLLARRGSGGAAAAGTPYAAARLALRRYAIRNEGYLWYVRRIVPVRMRGAFLDRAIERRAQERRRARA